MKLRNIPAGGIHGDERLREAAAKDFHDVINLVQGAVKSHLGLKRDEWIQTDAIYPDQIVIVREGRRIAYPYTIDDDNQVELGDAAEVIKAHEKVRMTEAQGQFIEAKGEKGNRFRIVVIKAGLSGNGVNYPDTLLREAAPMFDDVRVFAKSDEDHIKGKGKDVGKVIGKLTHSEFIEAKGDEPARIEADLVVLPSTGYADRLREALEEDMANLFGFSIDAAGRSRKVGRYREARSFTRVYSVDLIVEPGAGGELKNFIEALSEENTDMKLRDQMLAAIKQHNPQALKQLDVDDEQAVMSAYREAVAANDGDGKVTQGVGGGDPAGGSAPAAPAGVSAEDVDLKIRMVEARADARELIAGSKLPDAAKDKLRTRFAEARDFDIEDVKDAIKDEAEYLSPFIESGVVTGLGEASIEPGEDRADKVAKMMDAFFDPNDRSVRSFKECYVEITGDTRVTGSLRDCDTRRLREAIGSHFREALDSTSFADVLGDSITRRMVADYTTANSVYSVWMQLANIVPVNDFRTQERVRFGGYGDLPAVAEAAPYAALTSPNDEKASYAISKRGGTESVTLEMIRNDDVGSVQRIPVKLSRSAQRTLGKFVLDFVNDNPNIYDGTALFAAGHNNLLTAALDPSALAAARLQMLKQTELDSGERLGIPARNLWVPSDLEEAAVDLFRRNTNNDETFINSMSLNVIPVWYWTDPNNWYLSADKGDLPCVEVGFLDGNEEPELFVQDSPNVGSLFSNDQITWKIRHIYGGTVTDFRGLQGNVVA